jgi:uncharacterized membrane protein
LISSKKIHVSHLIVLGSYLGLFAVLLWSQWPLALPLSVFAWALWQGHWRSHIWLCFMLLFYFLVNINQLAQKPDWQEWFELACIVILFTSAMLWCRWSKQVLAENSGQGLTREN